MPYINKDGTIDKETKGDWIRCDICGKIEQLYDFDLDAFTEKGDREFTLRMEVDELYKQVRKGDIPKCMCVECFERAMPSIYKLRDVIELDIYVNKLKGAINEKRKQGTQDNRTTAHDACECCKGCAQRRPRHRQSDCFTQAGEEHF